MSKNGKAVVVVGGIASLVALVLYLLFRRGKGAASINAPGSGSLAPVLSAATGGSPAAPETPAAPVMAPSDARVQALTMTRDTTPVAAPKVADTAYDAYVGYTDLVRMLGTNVTGDQSANVQTFVDLWASRGVTVTRDEAANLIRNYQVTNASQQLETPAQKAARETASRPLAGSSDLYSAALAVKSVDPQKIAEEVNRRGLNVQSLGQVQQFVTEQIAAEKRMAAQATNVPAIDPRTLPGADKGWDWTPYGSLKPGIIRGWAFVPDGKNGFIAVPAKTIPGSTYRNDAQGAPPSFDEMAQLVTARKEVMREYAIKPLLARSREEAAKGNPDAYLWFFGSDLNDVPFEDLLDPSEHALYVRARKSQRAGGDIQANTFKAVQDVTEYTKYVPLPLTWLAGGLAAALSNSLGALALYTQGTNIGTGVAATRTGLDAIAPIQKFNPEAFRIGKEYTVAATAPTAEGRKQATVAAAADTAKFAASGITGAAAAGVGDIPTGVATLNSAFVTGGANAAQTALRK